MKVRSGTKNPKSPSADNGFPQEKRRWVMSREWYAVVAIVTIMFLVFVGSIALADEGTVGIHHGVSGEISKIRSGVLFVKTTQSLQFRTISPNKADRVGLHEARVKEPVVMLVDSGNVLLDVARADGSLPDHRIVAGTLRYADPYWGEIQLSTPEGFERFEVDALAGSKLSVFREGAPVAVELDADNVMVDIHRAR
jgi:translation elongation factor P/translation initiation factor 5A